MDRVRFGRLVRSMRMERLFFDDADEFRQWTQAHLAVEAGLTPRQVARIEQGTAVNLQPHLDPLADAFGLGPIERAEFFAQAGYLQDDRPAETSADVLRALLSTLPYPAYARTPLWDFVAYNASSARLWGYDNPELAAALAEGPLGANILRTIFDPRFGHEARKGGRGAWLDDADRCLIGFRMMALKRGHTARYRVILAELKRLPEFRRRWELLDEAPREVAAGSSLVRVVHTEYGRLDFVSTRIPQRYVGGDIEVGMYVPLAGSERGYAALRSAATGGVTMFQERLRVDS